MRIIGSGLITAVLASSLACNEFSLTSEDDVVESEDSGIDIVDSEVTDEPVATEEVYAHTRDTLYSIDPGTGTRTYIGSFRDTGGNALDGMVDLAIDMQGVVYGATWDSLFRIDPNTAQATWICDTAQVYNALTFTSEGVLYGGSYDGLYRVDFNTCSSSPLLDDEEYSTSGDLVGLPDGYLYWTVTGDPNDEVVRVDPNNGATRWMGRTGFENLFGLGYHNGQLYGFSDVGEVVRVSPTNGQSTLVASDGGLSWWGATTNPVVW